MCFCREKRSGDSVNSQLPELIPETANASDEIYSSPSPNCIKKEEAGEEQQGKKKIPPGSSEGPLTSQVSKSIPKTADALNDISRSSNANCIDKEEIGKVNLEKTKIPPSISDCSSTSQVSKSIPGIADASNNIRNYPSPNCIEKEETYDEEYQEKRKNPPSISDCSSTSQVSKSIPGIADASNNIRNYPSPNCIEKEETYDEEYQEKTKREEIPLTSSENTFFRKIFLRRETEPTFSIVVPIARELKLKHPNVLTCITLTKEQRLLEVTGVQVYQLPTWSTVKQLMYPAIQILLQRSDLPQQDQKEKLPLRDFESKKAQQHER